MSQRPLNSALDLWPDGIIIVLCVVLSVILVYHSSVVSGIVLILLIGSSLVSFSIFLFRGLYIELLDYEKSVETYSTGERIKAGIRQGYALVLFFLLFLSGLFLIGVGLIWAYNDVLATP